jgi:hypothetical protein
MNSSFPLLFHFIQRPNPFVKTADFLLILILRKNLPSTARMKQTALTQIRQRTCTLLRQPLTKCFCRENDQYQGKGEYRKVSS